MSKDFFLKRYWKMVTSPAGKVSMGALIAFGFVGALVLHGSFNAAMEFTNTQEFCVSCHKDDVYQEFQSTVHFSNASGVQADCASCHLPKEFIPKMARKAKASLEVMAELTGKVDTPEKFDAHRREMADREWERMIANDSKECRTCHNQKAMDLAEQSLLAMESHTKAQETGETCIQCHKGIAHKLPNMKGVPGWD